MNARKLLIAVAAVALAALPAIAGNQDIHPYDLFPGGNTDSTEQASRWITVRGAAKVYIRIWTTHAAFTGTGSGDVDSTFADSLVGFRLLLSDSVSFLGRDSLGTLVTARSTMSNVGAFPVCADSFEVPITGIGDTLVKSVRYWPAPVNRALRAPATGSGFYTVVTPARIAQGSPSDPDAIIPAQYLRVRCTPLRRLTAQMSQSTTGARVNGLKGFKMTAYVVYDNK